MTEQEYQKISDLFNAIRELPEQQRPAALDALCGSDVELRAHVAKMLDAHRRAAGDAFLERSGMEDVASLVALGLPASGTVLGKYRIERRIGAGGMGVVYEAQDLSLDRRVAIKILAPGFSGNVEERLQRFQREARAAAQLTHPHIAAIYDAVTDHSCAYIAMEFVEGRTLRELITPAANLPDLTSVVEITGQMVSALGAAHAAGIIHRDIKPENVMIRPDGFVKVLDFGLASVREPSSKPLSQPGQIAGTMQYLSPEQVLGQKVDGRSDLFSAGVVAYELATGVPPFDGPTDGAIFEAILHHNPKPPSQIRPELGLDFDHLILQALQKDREQRFQSGNEFRNSCLRLTRLSTPGNGISIPAASPRSMGWSWKEWAIVSALSILVCLAVFMAWSVFQPPPPVHVARIVQITKSDDPIDRFVSDGPRIIYAAGPENASIRMFQVSATGGEPAPLPQMNGMFPMDVSPDRSQILLGQYTSRIGPFPLWIASALGDAPRRLGVGLAGEFARWSPEGDKIAYSEQGTLKIVRSDGLEPRNLVQVTGYIEDAAWSPDGRSLCFTVSLPNSRRIWEVGADGTGLHMLFPRWTMRWSEMGVWTPDSRHFLFSAGDISHDLWMSSERKLPFAHWDAAPIRLTNGPFWAYHPHTDASGRRVYFLAESNIGQLVFLDPAAKEWKPFLGGIDAVQVDYSRDGKWIAYADSNGCLWRRAADGSQRIQLSAPPLYAHNPRWSPDGQEVLFYAAEVGLPDAVYLTPSAGGALTRLTPIGKAAYDDGTWSSDGLAVIYCEGPNTGDRTQRHLVRMQLQTKQTQTLAGTTHLWSPRWSPDGLLVAALDQSSHLVLYNIATHDRKELTEFAAGYPMWSRDSRYIYFENNSSTEWYKVSVATGAVQPLANLVGLKTPVNSAGWVGMSPAATPISTRAVSSTNVYALDWTTK